MSFDPNLPQENTPVDAAQMRAQFNGLAAMIAAVPGLTDVVIDSVTTLPPGSAATVSVTFDGTNVHFTFGIPQGAEGAQGLPGEVTNAQLATAISMAVAGTSNNTNAVPTLDTPFTNDPPTLADMELMRAKYNELVLAARR